MKKNMGNADRVIRVILAVVVVGLYYSGILTGTWAVVLLIIAGIFFLTSLIGYCPLYAPFGLSTCARRHA